MDPIQPGSQPFHITDPRQRRIHEKLGTLIGPGAAQFYFDACHLISEPHGLYSVSHIIGHVLREVQGMIIDSLVPPTQWPPNEKNAYAKKIERVVKTFGWDSQSSNNDWIDLWKHVAKKGDDLSPERWTHRLGTGLCPRPMGDKFQELVECFDYVVDSILYYFEKTYHDVVGPQIDELLAHREPEQGAKCLRKDLPNSPAVMRHFFGRLNDPCWIGPLNKEGYFSSPPQPTPTEDGFILIPPWPQAEYLKRMASSAAPVQQAEIGEILTAVEPAENLYVRIDLVDVALALPASNAVAWADNEARRVECQESLDSLLAHKLIAVLPHLENGDEQLAALRLATAMLSVCPPTDKAIRTWVPKVRTLVDYDEYEDLLSHVVKIANTPDAAPLVLDAVCHLLNRTLQVSYGDVHDGGTGIDRSGRLREKIQDDTTRFEDVEDLLICAVRDTVKAAIDGKALPIDEIVSQLESFGWRVFRRLALHVLSLFPDPDLIAERLADEEAFLSFDHEYEELLQNHFGAMPVDLRIEMPTDLIPTALVVTLEYAPKWESTSMEADYDEPWANRVAE